MYGLILSLVTYLVFAPLLHAEVVDSSEGQVELLQRSFRPDLNECHKTVRQVTDHGLGMNDISGVYPKVIKTCYISYPLPQGYRLLNDFPNLNYRLNHESNRSSRSESATEVFPDGSQLTVVLYVSYSVNSVISEVRLNRTKKVDSNSFQILKLDIKPSEVKLVRKMIDKVFQAMANSLENSDPTVISAMVVRRM